MTTEQKAKLLIAEVRRALAAGTLHYDVYGRLLRTDVEILSALVRDGRVDFKPKEQNRA